VDATDTVYYNAVDQLPLAKRVLARARYRMFELFMRSMEPTSTTTILDIGVSEHENDEANFLEKMYPNKSNITCASIGDGERIRACYPEVSHVTITPGMPLPFADRKFDIAYSNAVLEHVGGYEARHEFLSEALRVANSLFIAVPNSWFPVEHHTGIPFLHYWPWLFRTSLKGTSLKFWAEPRNLEFLSAAKLRNEWPPGVQPKFFYTGISLGPCSSNLAATVRR
jgi:SAM-dependent methyltransferase